VIARDLVIGKPAQVAAECWRKRAGDTQVCREERPVCSLLDFLEETCRHPDGSPRSGDRRDLVFLFYPLDSVGLSPLRFSIKNRKSEIKNSPVTCTLCGRWPVAYLNPSCSLVSAACTACPGRPWERSRMCGFKGFGLPLLLTSASSVPSVVKRSCCGLLPMA
jgi:hypothetical protein